MKKYSCVCPGLNYLHYPIRRRLHFWSTPVSVLVSVLIYQQTLACLNWYQNNKKKKGAEFLKILI